MRGKFHIRCKPKMLEALGQIADEMEKATGLPVTQQALIRKFILDGIDRWQSEHKRAKR